MTGDRNNQEHIDRVARALHAEAVAQVPPHTLARLRPRAAPARRRHRWPAPAWPLAAAGAAVLVLAVGVRTLVAPDLDGADPGRTAPGPAVATAPAAVPAFDPYEDPLITFEEDPDLFVWLASEARPLAME